jgi:predicted nuclease of restriction endonuclease-like (RecB) superfamily
MRVENEAARQFYLEEAAKCGWSSRQLDRQINSFYYQRILASKDKASVSAEINTVEPKAMSYSGHRLVVQ